MTINCLRCKHCSVIPGVTDMTEQSPLVYCGVKEEKTVLILSGCGLTEERTIRASAVEIAWLAVKWATCPLAYLISRTRRTRGGLYSLIYRTGDVIPSRPRFLTNREIGRANRRHTAAQREIIRQHISSGDWPRQGQAKEGDLRQRIVEEVAAQGREMDWAAIQRIAYSLAPGRNKQ